MLKYYRKPSTCFPAKSLFMHKSLCKVLTKTTMLRNVLGQVDGPAWC